MSPPDHSAMLAELSALLGDQPGEGQAAPSLPSSAAPLPSAQADFLCESRTLELEQRLIRLENAVGTVLLPLLDNISD